MANRTWLVQRLKRPLTGFAAKATEAFCFGGGGGRLKPEALDLLRDVWSFDYMGAAEFEWGAVPEALHRMSGAELEAFTLEVQGGGAPKWRRSPKGSKPPPAKTGTVYVIAPAHLRAHAEKVVREQAADEHPTNGEAGLKEASRLWAALFGDRDFDRDVCGWLELDNGFAWFTDREMFDRACALFGVREALETPDALNNP